MYSNTHENHHRQQPNNIGNPGQHQNSNIAGVEGNFEPSSHGDAVVGETSSNYLTAEGLQIVNEVERERILDQPLPDDIVHTGEASLPIEVADEVPQTIDERFVSLSWAEISEICSNNDENQQIVEDASYEDMISEMLCLNSPELSQYSLQDETPIEHQENHHQNLPNNTEDTGNTPLQPTSQGFLQNKSVVCEAAVEVGDRNGAAQTLGKQVATRCNDLCVSKGNDPVVPTRKMGKRAAKEKVHWSDDKKRIFLALCIEQVREGRRPNASFDKEGWRKIAKAFNKNNNTDWEIEKFKTHYIYMRNSWEVWNILLSRHLGWGWCNETQSVDPPSKEVWKDFKKTYKHGSQFNHGPFQFEKQCEQLFGNASGVENDDNDDSTQHSYTSDDNDDYLTKELESSPKKQKKASGLELQKKKNEDPLVAKDMRTDPNAITDTMERAMKMLNELVDPISDPDLYFNAIEVLRDQEINRVIFLNLEHVHLLWLRSEISKKGSRPK